MLKMSLSSGHGQRQQAAMCCACAARTSCLPGSKNQVVMDLEVTYDLSKFFHISKKKMGLPCTQTLKSKKKQYLEVIKNTVLRRLLEDNIWQGD